MSKRITRDQVNAINAKMSNGWALDVNYYLTWGGKQAVKRINLDTNTYLLAVLCYMDSYDTHKPAYGSAYNVPNGKKHITLHLSVWHTRPDSILASSTGYGQWIRVGEDAPRKSFAAIQQLTAKYTDADIMLLCDPRKHDCDSALLAC